MNISVVAFFVHSVLASLFLGAKFAGRESKALKVFGYALLLDAVAFAAWLFGVLQTNHLIISVTVGAVAYLLSLVLMLNASQQESGSSTRNIVTILGLIAVGVIFYIGHINPNFAFISNEGYLFFNLSPMVQMLYIVSLLLASMPIIHLVSSKFSSPYSTLVKYGFIAEVAGGVMLIVSSNVQVLTVIGWAVGVVYLALWSTLLFNKNAWTNVN